MRPSPRPAAAGRPCGHGSSALPMMVNGDDCSVTVSAARVSSLQGSLTLAGHHRGQIAAPHRIDPIGGDRAVVGPRAARPAGTLVRQQAALAHEPQDPAPAGADAGEAQPRPQLAVALAMEGAVRQKLADRHHQVLVRHGPERAGALALAHLGGAAVAIDGRPCNAPEVRDPQEAVDLGGGGRNLPAHRLDLRRPKGRCVSRRSIFASKSSAVIVSSPTLACSRSIAASRASAGRLFSDASPAARNWLRQPLSSAAVTPSAREISSRSSPRNRRSTASCLRRADIRRRGSGVGPAPPAWGARPPRPTPAPTPSSLPPPPSVAYPQNGVSLNCRPGELPRCPPPRPP